MNIKKIINSYLDQHVIAFQSGAIGGLSRGGNDIVRYRRSNPDSPPPKKASRALIAVPSNSGNNFDMKEVSHVYRAFKKVGYKIDFATADGSPVQFSKSDLTDSVNRWFVEDANAQYSVDQPLEVKNVVPSRYVGVFFVESNELLTENRWFQSLAEQVLENNGVVAGSGDEEEAVESLGLMNYLESAYSLPASDGGRAVSDYGSAAAEAVKQENGWIIHKNELVMAEEDETKSLAERIIQQFTK